MLCWEGLGIPHVPWVLRESSGPWGVLRVSGG